MDLDSMVQKSMSFENQYAWQDGFMPLIKQIVGCYVTVQGSYWEDTKENTDLRILKSRNLTTSCRLRKPKYKDKYEDFTIRIKSQSGYQTEFDKVCMGFGDIMFYGIANGLTIDRGIYCWALINLDVFRYHLIKHPIETAAKRFRNDDGTEFNVYQYKNFKYSPSLLICSYNLDGSSDIPIKLWTPDNPDLFGSMR